MDSNNATYSSDSSALIFNKRVVNKVMSKIREMLTLVSEAIKQLTSALVHIIGPFVDQLNVVVLTLLSHALGINATNPQLQAWFRSRRFELLPPLLPCVPNIRSPRGPPSTFVK